jgi:hypothetical protein
LKLRCSGKIQTKAVTGSTTKATKTTKAARCGLQATESTSKPVTLDLTREDPRAEALAAVKRGDAVLVASATLGESVYWVRDARRAKRLKREPGYQGQVIYTLAELKELTGQSPELLRDIHQFKKTFGATLQKTTKEDH